ncbi:MAG: EamA family transporter [Chloroflexi bacterium]|nr:EamA family transporter [Chloroflexota bacterium]
MVRSQFWRGTIYGITAASIWGSMYVVSDLVLEVVPPFTLLSARVLLALLVLWPLSRRRGLSPPPRLRLAGLMMVGIVGIGISLGTQFIGTDLSTAVNGALITSASPAFVVLFALLILREKLTAARLFVIVLATAGVLIIVDPTSTDFNSETFLGDVFLAASAVTWGLYSVLVRRIAVSHEIPTLAVTVFALLGGLLVALPGSAMELSLRPIGIVSPGIVFGVLYLGLACTAFALLLWNRAFALVPATIASLFFFAQPLSGAILAALFLGQSMTPALWLGGALIVLAVLFSLQRPARKSANEQAAT